MTQAPSSETTSPPPARDSRGGWLAALQASLARLLPAPEVPIPAPTGPFAIGTTQQTLAVSETRILTLDIWYPASSTAGYPVAPYAEKRLNEALSRQFRMPRFMFSEKPSYSHREAPPAPGPHPVVLFNHGYASFSKQNVSTFQELASHGFVVISLAHPGESLLAQDGLGNPVFFDPQSEVNREISRLQKDLRTYAQRLAERLSYQRQAHTPEAYAIASAQVAQDPQFVALRPQIARWVEDTRQVIVALQTGRGEGILREADPQNLTVMGHSLGGLVAMRLACEFVEGLRGIINLDGPWLHEDPEAHAVPRVPSLNLLSTHYRLGKHNLSTRGTLDGLYRETSAAAHLVTLQGTSHYNFTDLNFVPALKLSGMLGPIDTRLMGELQNQAIREFLRRTARSEGEFEAPLLPEHAAVEQVVHAGRRVGARA